MSDELEAERAKPPPVDHTAELEALHAQLSAQMSAHGAQVATLQLELEVAHVATAAAAAATALEAAAHEATRATLRTIEDAHAAAMAALEQRHLADLATLKEVHASEVAKLKGYLAARQVAQIALCHTLDDADDELKEERRYRERAAQAVAAAERLGAQLGEAVSKAVRSTQHLDDVHGVVREAIEELLELRQRAGETASKGAAIVPHSDSWYYTGRSGEPLPDWLMSIHQLLEPPNAPVADRLRILLDRYKAVVAASVAEVRSAHGKAQEAESSLKSARANEARLEARRQDLLKELKSRKADFQRIEQNLQHVTEKLEGTQVAAAAERSHLVQSALASLHLLRVHLAAQAGVRSDAAAKLEGKREGTLAGLLYKAALVRPRSASPPGQKHQHQHQQRQQAPAATGHAPSTAYATPGAPDAALPPLPSSRHSGRGSPEAEIAGMPPHAPADGAAAAAILGGSSPRHRRTAKGGGSASARDGAFASSLPVGLRDAAPHPPPSSSARSEPHYILPNGTPVKGPGQYSARVQPEVHHPSARKANWHEVQTVEMRAARAVGLGATTMNMRYATAKEIPVNAWDQLNQQNARTSPPPTNASPQLPGTRLGFR